MFGDSAIAAALVLDRWASVMALRGLFPWISDRGWLAARVHRRGFLRHFSPGPAHVVVLPVTWRAT